MKPLSAASTKVLFAILLMLFGSTIGFGQVRSATLAGTVQDAAGRVVPGANVTVFETATSQTMK